MKRYRDDSVKPGCGVDETEGEDYTKKFNVGNMNNPDVYPGGQGSERSRAGNYTTNDAGLRRDDDFEGSAGSRQIWQDVEDNQNPNGEFASTGPIRAGVNRGQK
jgi:hypothetical protein